MQDVSEGASNPEMESWSTPMGQKTEPAAIQGNNNPKRRKILKRKLLADTEERDKRDKLLELACDRLRSMSDDVKILAISWAMDFRKLKPNQQIYAKKAINDILVEGQLGNLHKHTLTISDHLHVPCLLLHHTQINHHNIQVIICHIQTILL